MRLEPGWNISKHITCWNLYISTHVPGALGSAGCIGCTAFVLKQASDPENTGLMLRCRCPDIPPGLVRFLTSPGSFCRQKRWVGEASHFWKLAEMGPTWSTPKPSSTLTPKSSLSRNEDSATKIWWNPIVMFVSKVFSFHLVICWPFVGHLLIFGPYFVLSSATWFSEATSPETSGAPWRSWGNRTLQKLETSDAFLEKLRRKKDHNQILKLCGIL